MLFFFLEAERPGEDTYFERVEGDAGRFVESRGSFIPGTGLELD